MTLPGITRKWADMNIVFRNLIAEMVGADTNVGPEVPDDLATRAWFIRTRRIDGGNDEFNDFPVMEVDVFAPTYAVAEPLARDVREWLMRRRASPLIDRIDCPTGPHELPWGDGRMRRFGALYDVVARKTAA